MASSDAVASATQPSQDALGPPDNSGADEKPKSAWNLARTIVSVVFCGYGVIAVLDVVDAASGLWATTLALGLLIVLLSIQLFYFSRPGTRLHSLRSYVLLAAQALLAYVPLLKFGQAWVGLPSFVAGSVLLVLPMAVGWVAYGAVVTSMAAVQGALDSSTLDLIYTTIGVGLFGLEVYLLTRLAGLVADLHTTRTELAQMAVAEERLRFARDLHDLLGLSLSAIALKGELAHRLVRRIPERAAQELAEIVDIARRALVDVRSVADGYQELSLEQEARSAESVLVASNVELRMALDYGDLPMAVRTVLGTVLREGVTNILRHSKAERCEITIRQRPAAVTMDIVNDGVPDRAPDDAARPGPDGSGTRNLSHRVAVLGGTLVAGPESAGGFALRVRIPLKAGRGQWGTRDREPGRVSPERHAAQRAARARRALDSGTALPIDARTARVLVTVVFVLQWLAAAVHVLYLTDEVGRVATSIGFLTALLVLQLAYANRSTRRPPTAQSYALLFVQACLIYLPLFQLTGAWVSLPGFLAGTALLVLRPGAGLAVFVATIGSVIAVNVCMAHDLVEITFNSVATVISGLVVYGLTSLMSLVGELDAVRVQLARMAVAEERLRFARDLQELLGLRLSGIALKTELAHQLLPADPGTAADEVVEILDLARQALADVRSVAKGYRELSLDNETRSAESVLAAADVDVRMDIGYGDLPVLVRTVLAVALREGVTNVLRHSRAERCEIAIRQAADQVSLSIVNDGVPAEASPAEAAPTEGGAGGIHSLKDRVAQLGGEVQARLAEDGRYRLRVHLPV